MKYAVFGAGGTGGCIGAYLNRAEKDVTLIARGKHLETIRGNGITVRSAGTGDFCIRIKACADREYAEHPDVIFVCVKYYSLQDAIDFVNRTAGPDFSHLSGIPEGTAGSSGR